MEKKIMQYSGLVNIRILLVICIFSISLKSTAQIQFQNVTDIAGPFHTGESRGATWCDINADGFVDLLTSNHRRPASVYHNNDGQFTNVTALVDASGVWQQVSGNDTHGITCVDFDNDGDQDLLQSTGSCCPPYFLVNNNGIFKDETTARNIADDRGGQFGSWFDFTRDGLLDLTYHKLMSGATMKQGTDNRFYIVTNSLASGSCQRGSDMGQLSDLDGDGDVELICIKANFPTNVYEVVPTPWIDIGHSITKVGLVTDSAIADFTGDLEPDFFLTRGRRVPSQALRIGNKKVESYLVNGSSLDKGFTFESTGVLTVVIDTLQLNEPRTFIGSNGIHPVDIDDVASTFTFELDPASPDVAGIKPHTPGLHEDRGVYIGFEPAENRWEILLSPVNSAIRVYIIARSTTTVSNVVEIGFEESDGAYFPSLLINNNGSFTDQRASRGFDKKLRCNSGVPGDFDNDGDVDLYVVCREGIVNLPNRIYVNDGDGNFTRVTSVFGGEGIVGAGINAKAGTGDVAVVADYDNDGRLDLFVTNGIRMRPVNEGGPDQLFRNITANNNNWILLELVGAGAPNSNRDAIGAKVFLTADGKTQLRQQNGKFHRWSQDDKRIHFGIGSATIVSELEVKWPSGLTEQFTNIVPNKRYRVFEGGVIDEIIEPGNGPRVSVSNSTATESAGSIKFTFLLSQASSEVVTVNFATADNVATEEQDYTKKSGTIIFNPGEIKKVRKVIIIDDSLFEPNESFSIILDDAQNAIIGNSIASGTIIDNDGGSIDPCGNPAADASTDYSLFLWQDCNQREWHIQIMTANSPSAKRFSGTLNASDAFTSAIPVGFEPSDVLNNSPSSLLDFSMIAKTLGVDGFVFTYPVGASVCFDLSILPSGAQVLVGQSRTPLTPPFDLANFANCVP